MNDAELFKQSMADNTAFLKEEARIKERLTEAEAEVERQHEINM